MNSVTHSDKIKSCLCVIAVITLMVGAAEFSGESEIIFPEIAAICIGGFADPKLVWKTSLLRMFICIMICAVSGVAIVRFVAAPLWMQVVLAFIIGNAVLMLSGTTFVPMISAIALPVLIQTDSIIYILSAGFFTGLVIGLRILLEKDGVKERENYTPVYRKPGRAEAFRLIAVIAIAYLAIAADFRFCIAPPLLVAFTEMVTNPEGNTTKRVKAALLVTLLSLSGALVRFLIVMKAGLPDFTGAIVISILILLLVKAVGLPYPPAGAMAVLAMLIPEEVVVIYPLQVFIGIGIFTLLAEVFDRCIKCRN